MNRRGKLDRIYLGLLVILAICLCYSPGVFGEVVLSPYTGILKQKQENAQQKGITRSSLADRVVGLYIEIEDESIFSKIEESGFRPVRHQNNVLTLRCLISDIDKLTRINGIVRIQVSGNVQRRLYRTTREIGATAAQNGVGDPIRYYTGEGVIVAVLDFGFDLTHPAFVDKNGNTRILRLWDQTAQGTPPSGFSYGVEYQGAALAQKAHTSDEYHGTHVAGIAAGRGVNTDKKFQGIAPDASLILVELGEVESDLSDAIKYVFDYAASVHKSAVINLSLGTHLGPHDGTSNMDRIIDSYSGSGKIIVGAAGNEGEYNMHLSKIFTNKEKIHTLIDFYEEGNAEKVNYVDVWTKKYAEHFDWRVYVYDQYGSQLSKTGIHNTATARTSDHLVIGNVTIQIESQTEKVVSNRRNNFFLSIENPKMNDYRIVLEIEASNDTIHMWNLAYDQSGISFSTLPSVTEMNWITGDNNCSVGEIGGTAKRIISVGATVPEIGSRCNYSSLGPTRDGRIKPDIMAPGDQIAAPINSFATDKPFAFYSTQYKGKTYTYGKMSGTSMATPHVVGAIALFLQKNPTLTPEAIKSILAEQAFVSNQSGELPNSTWGYGSLRVLGYLQAPFVERSNYLIFPNPSQGAFTIRGPEYIRYSVEIYSMQGQKVYEGVGEGESSYRMACIAGHYAVIIRTSTRVESHMILIGNPK